MIVRLTDDKVVAGRRKPALNGDRDDMLLIEGLCTTANIVRLSYMSQKLSLVLANNSTCLVATLPSRKNFKPWDRSAMVRRISRLSVNRELTEPYDNILLCATLTTMLSLAMLNKIPGYICCVMLRAEYYSVLRYRSEVRWTYNCLRSHFVMKMGDLRDKVYRKNIN